MVENKEQQEVINTIDGQLLVIAGPGSGKTTTMINRIGHMVNDCHIPPQSILMVTFTKAAADEMKARYRKFFGDEKGITFSTIHSLCWRILRYYLKYDKNQVFQEYEARAFFFDAIKRDYSINDRESFVTNLLTQITSIKNNLIKPEDYEPFEISKEKFISLYKAYEEHKKALHKVDFDDMQIVAMRYLLKNKEVLAYLQSVWKYIIVDEYQDINIVQRNICYMLAGRNGHLTVVGDDDQSIYHFRGANPQLILNFTNDYPDAKTFYLNTNYRSLPEIVKMSQNLIRYNDNRFEKDLKAFRNESNGIVSYHSYTDKELQYSNLIGSLAVDSQKGIKADEIAILYRTNQQSERIADILLRTNLPFYSNDTFKSKYEHWIYKDIWAYHRLAIGEPDKGDIFQVINHPNRYLPKECAYCGLDEEAMIKASLKGKTEDWQIDSAILNVQRFFTLLRTIAAAPTPWQAMDAMKGYNYLEYLEDYEYEDASDLKDIWNQLYSEAKNYSSWDKWEASALQYEAAMQAALKSKKGICLSTMHKSKGLEWKKVYIIDAVKGLHPFAKASTPEQLEEERRLFYVGATRAKDELVILTYERSGGKKFKESPYVREMLTGPRIETPTMIDHPPKYDPIPGMTVKFKASAAAMLAQTV